MNPQFVDFNADGHMDIVTATFDGSPWVSLGSKEGFLKPSQTLDKNGKRVILAQFWNYEAKKWDNADHTAGAGADAHCISAIAFDWDNDGDFDLILGDRKGHLWLQLNEGSNKEPKFAGVSNPVMLGDKPLDAGGKVTSPRAYDWDGDGLTDLVYGTFGDDWGAGKGGGIKWLRNVGKAGAPAFEAPRDIIEDSPKGATGATRPDAGCYFDIADYDGDGKVDLIVGGYSLWPGEKAANGRVAQNRKPFVWVYLQKADKPKPEGAPVASPSDSPDSKPAGDDGK